MTTGMKSRKNQRSRCSASRALSACVLLTLSGNACEKGNVTMRPGARGAAELAERAAGGVIYLTDFEQGGPLDRIIEKGFPVFRLNGDKFDLLEKCWYPAEAQTSRRPIGERTIAGKSEGDLSLNAARGVAYVGFRRQSEYAVHITIIGQKQAVTRESKAPLEHPGLANLDGSSCAGATHVGLAVELGAFNKYQFKSVGGRAGAEGSSVGAHGGVSADISVLSRGGELSNCSQKSEDELPLNCDVPVSAVLTPLEIGGVLSYHFDTTGIRSIRGKDVSIPTSDLEAAADKFAKEIEFRARKAGIRAEKLPKSVPGQVECGVSSGATAGVFTLVCDRANQRIHEIVLEPQALMGGVGPMSERVLAFVLAEEFSDRRSAGRVVILVDISASMLINDSETFVSSDTRRSERYQIVAAMLRAILENRVDIEVGVVLFAGHECTYPLNVKDKSMWALTDSKLEVMLDALASSLKYHDKCKPLDGTDLSGAFAAAGELLDQSSSDSNAAIVMITDGAHTWSGLPMTPKEACEQLINKGVSVNVVRVQLNDPESLRIALEENSLREQWLKFIRFEKRGTEAIEELKKLFTETMSDDNEVQLIKDLDGLALDNFVIGGDDALSDPLLTVHKHLLPQLIGVEPVSVKLCQDARVIERSSGNRGLRQVCQITLGSGGPYGLTINPDACMGGSISVTLETDDSHQSMQSSLHFFEDLEVLWREGGIMALENFEVPYAKGNSTRFTLTIEGDLEGTPKCKA